MAELTVATIFESRGRTQLALEATNAVQFYAGQLVYVNRTTGRVVLYSDSANLRFLGQVIEDVLGNTSASPIPEVKIDGSGKILKRVTVTGVSAITDVGKEVWPTNGNPNDMTLTADTNTKAVGMIVRWYSSTTVDVMLFTLPEHFAKY